MDNSNVVIDKSTYTEPYPLENVENVDENIEEVYMPNGGHSLYNFDCGEKDMEYIGGMFPKGKVTLLCGESRKGKGWVLPAASLSLTSGIPFLPYSNYEVKDTGKCLLIDTEERIRTYVRRIKELGGRLDHYLTVKEPLDICTYNKEDCKLIESVIEKDDVELVIIDSFAGFSLVDENTCAVLPALMWFSKIALKYNCALVFTQLVNKSDLKDGRLTTKSIRGFSGIHQFPELIWAIDTPSTDSDKIKRLYQIKNNIQQRDTNDYVFTLDNSSITWREEAVVTQVNRMQVRQEVFLANVDKSNMEIAQLIHDVEPSTKITALNQWVIRARQKYLLTLLNLTLS